MIDLVANDTIIAVVTVVAAAQIVVFGTGVPVWASHMRDSVVTVLIVFAVAHHIAACSVFVIGIA